MRAVEYSDRISVEGKDPPLNVDLAYDNKPSDDEALVLDLWGMWSTSSLP